MPQAVASELLLFADDTCIVFQHNSVIEIEKHLITDFSRLCDWFIDNKLNIHFRQNKTKSILFGTKHKLRNTNSKSIVYNGTEIKHHAKVKYLGCILDKSLSDGRYNLFLIMPAQLGFQIFYRN